MKFAKISFYIISIYILIALIFYAIAYDQLHETRSVTEMLQPYEPIGELTEQTEVRQQFRVNADEVEAISLMLSTYIRANTSTMDLHIEDMSGNILGSIKIPTNTILDNEVTRFEFSPSVRIQPLETYQLVLTTQDGIEGNTITAWYGTSLSTAKGPTKVQIQEWEQVSVGGERINGKLCYQLEISKKLLIGKYYWQFVAIIGTILLIYIIYTIYHIKQGKTCFILRLADVISRYNYLLRQLVARDFKTKYKRSVLGIFWSFLNPLLTMMIQYIVFSTLFKSDIPNFAIYLLIGIVIFSFFNEAVSVSLLSIVVNASLITKVYVPKCIYPISKVLSSGINLIFSTILLFVVMAFTNTPFTPALLLLPFALTCLLFLCIGLGLLLSTFMVFFRDTQFLWGVVCMLWMYATPIFYPESIIPEKFNIILTCNPLYYIIKFIRIIMIDGVSPEPKMYLYCIMAAAIPLLVGAFVFKRNEDNFVVNL